MAGTDVEGDQKSKDAARYRSQSFEEEIDDRTYRFIVVHSSKLDGRKERGINNGLDKIEKQRGDLNQRNFACEADAWRSAKTSAQTTDTPVSISMPKLNPLCSTIG